MTYRPRQDVPKSILLLFNNVYDIERKLSQHGDPGNAKRNIEKIKELLPVMRFCHEKQCYEGVFYEDPLGQTFKETRTDLEATISGQSTEDLEVVEVIKPIIRCGTPELSRVVQRGIVVVQAKHIEENPQ